MLKLPAAAVGRSVRAICQLHHQAAAQCSRQPATSTSALCIGHAASGSLAGQPGWNLLRHSQGSSSAVSGLQRAYGTRVVVVASAAEAPSTVELEVKVEGMKCGGCSSRVEAVLKAMDNVKGVQVDLDKKLATVEVEAPNLIDAMNMLPTFVQAIKELGFEAEPHIEYQL